jgi:hypothetical protein
MRANSEQLAPPQVALQRINPAERTMILELKKCLSPY